MIRTSSAISQTSSSNGELVIESRFVGRSFVAVVRVLVKGESVIVNSLDLAKESQRETFVNRLIKCLPAVDPEDVDSKLMKLCDDRATWLKNNHNQDGQKGDELSVADLLVRIAFKEVELSHDRDRTAYGTIKVNNHWEAWPIKTKRFKLWLRCRLRQEQDSVAYPEALNTAIEEIEAKAIFEGPEKEVSVRLAEHDNAIWLDLADENWRTVRIDSSGWEVIADRPPVQFVRPRGMLPLVAPEAGGGIDDLRQFLNVKDEADFVLLVAWLLACLRPHGPFPILSVSGEQGSAKSTLQRLLRSLIDPNSAPLRTAPREPRDLMISAMNSWFLAYDNLSAIPAWLSDAICRLSTGGGFATRELYTDREEVIFDSKRPVMFNGITDLAIRSDLLDRSLVITLGAISEEDRKDERRLWQSFDAARPRILGALLDAVVAGLANVNSVRMERLPRMADFALWAVACERGLGWQEGTFMDAYTTNRVSSHDTAIEASLVGSLVQSFMANRQSWEGTSTELLTEFEQIANESLRRRRDWPSSPRKVSGDLRRVAPNLRAGGINVSFYKSGKRLIYIGRISAEPGAVCDGQPAGSESPNELVKLPLHHTSDGLDDVDGVLQDSVDTDVDMEERLAICTIDGGLSEAEAQATAEGRSNDTDGERN